MMEKAYLSWDDVSRLIDRIVPQVKGHFDALVAITRGGIVPGGLLSQRLRIHQVFVASVYFYQEEDERHMYYRYSTEDGTTLSLTFDTLYSLLVYVNGQPEFVELHPETASLKLQALTDPEIKGLSTLHFPHAPTGELLEILQAYEPLLQGKGLLLEKV